MSIKVPQLSFDFPTAIDDIDMPINGLGSASEAQEGYILFSLKISVSQILLT
jgi:hypothetical protein